jgi:hypothetical protein
MVAGEVWRISDAEYDCPIVGVTVPMVVDRS